MANASYQLYIPNHARQVAIAAHNYVTSAPIPGLHSATVQFGHPHDLMHVVGAESPELDSHMKQTAAFIGELANVPKIDVVKHGKQVAHWPIRNLNYQPVQTTPAPFAEPVQAPLPSALPMAGAAAQGVTPGAERVIV